MPLFTQYPALKIVQAMAKRGKRAVFLVGGFLRDYDLKGPGTDFDFAIDGRAVAFARSFARRIQGAFVLLDDAHGSARVVKNINGRAWTYDFTDLRGATIAADLALRDFTVNTLCVAVDDLDDLAKHTIEAKGARQDLKAKVVRMVSPRIFKDDPLRLLRAYTLWATLGFNIEAKTLARIKKDKNLITGVAMERVREEFFKILASPRAHETLAAMDRVGLLPKVIPQVAAMVDVPQGGYHHLDVWKHSLEVVRQLEILLVKERADALVAAYLDEDIGGAHTRQALLKMAALLHDIGKPETRRQEEKRVTFHGHEHAGVQITRHVAKHLKLSVKERYFLEDMVRMHLRPGYLSNFKAPSAKAVFRYLRDTKEEAVSLALLALADQSATRGPLTTKAKHQHHANICRMMMGRYFQEQQKAAPRARLLTGYDLIKKLKLKPSPLFGKILTAAEEAQALGKITTKEEALTFARKAVKKQ